MKIYFNGKLVPKEQAAVSVFDHGLLYGDGVFEGIRFYAGRVFRLDDHIDRLYRSARAIALTIPMTPDEMSQAVLETIRANGLQDGYVRLVVTRGEGSLGLSPKSCPRPTIFIIASTITLYPDEMYANGLKLVTCATRHGFNTGGEVSYRDYGEGVVAVCAHSLCSMLRLKTPVPSLLANIFISGHPLFMARGSSRLL